MNYKRAIGFSVLLYIASFIVYGLTFVLPFLDGENLALSNFVFMWVLTIPIVLLFAKWFFRSIPATVKNGFVLGVVAIIVGLSLDGLAVTAAYLAGESMDQFKELYGSWMFYATIIEIIVLTTFAGWEFDKTFTKRSGDGG